MKKHTDRIVILSQYYPPETGAPQNRLSDLAMRFKDTGYEIRVLTAKPNYPIGKIYPGFTKGFSQDTVQYGVPVTHCWICPSNITIFHRLVNYLSFVFSSIIVGLFKLPISDLVIVESPPLFLSISGWVLSRLKGAKLVLNISDLYPDTAISLGLIKNKFIIKVFYWLEKWSYNVSTIITGQTMGIVQSIKTRFPKKKFFLLTNGMSLGNIGVNNRSQVVRGLKNNNDFIIGYAGIIGYGQGLHNLFETAKDLQKFPSITFHIYGDGPLKKELETRVQEQSIYNIEFKGHYPHKEILEIMPSWDVGLVSLADISLMSGALPSKMFEIMAMRLPIFLIAPQGEASSVIEGAKAGICVPPDSPELITQAILRFYNDPKLRAEFGQNAFECVKNDFNRQAIFQDFLTFLQQEGLLS